MAIMNYPSGIGSDTDVNPGWIQFDIFERKSPKDSIPLDTINLYLPSSMRNPSTTSWGTDSLGILGNTIVGGVNDPSSASWSAGGDILKRVGMGMASNAAAAVIRQAGGNVSSDTLTGAIMGQVSNPYLTAVFKGVDFRTFEMQFKFVPVTEKDCDTIDRIIKTFRGAALPPGTAAQQSAYLGYPNEFDIRYIWRGKENKFLLAPTLYWMRSYMCDRSVSTRNPARPPSGRLPGLLHRATAPSSLSVPGDWTGSGYTASAGPT